MDINHFRHSFGTFFGVHGKGTRESRAPFRDPVDFHGELSVFSKQCCFLEPILRQFMYDTYEEIMRTSVSKLSTRCCILLYFWNFAQHRKNQDVVDSDEMVYLEKDKQKYGEKFIARLEYTKASRIIPMCKPLPKALVPKISAIIGTQQDKDDMDFVITKVLFMEEEIVDLLATLGSKGFRQLLPQVNSIMTYGTIKEEHKVRIFEFVNWYIQTIATTDKIDQKLSDVVDHDRWEKIDKAAIGIDVSNNAEEDNFALSKSQDSRDYISSIAGMRLPPFLLALFMNAGCKTFKGMYHSTKRDFWGTPQKNPKNLSGRNSKHILYNFIIQEKARMTIHSMSSMGYAIGPNLR